MGYFSTFDGEVYFDNPLDEFQVKIIDDGDLPFEVEEFGFTFHSEEGKYYSYKKDIELLMGVLDSMGVVANGRIMRTGEENNDYTLIIIKENKVKFYQPETIEVVFVNEADESDTLVEEM